jgi:SAM-dependent methyltransferase
MDPLIARRLLEINRRFYTAFGTEFSATRQRLQPGVMRILDGLRGDESILDLGCGNGGLARALAGRGFSGAYLGLDFSLPLLAEAGALRERFLFAEADLTGRWEDVKSEKEEAKPLLFPSHFSLITSFATLHHIPSMELRLNLLAKAHSLLTPAGTFVHSEWQFLNSPKLRARIQPWSDAGLSDADVDPNDYLLDWRAGGRGLRYVHHFDEAELEALAAASKFHVRQTFRSDGNNGQLGLYQVWEKL